MYEALKDVSDDLNTLSEKSTTTALKEQRIAALCSALIATAEELDQAAQESETPEDLANIKKLYQGMLAAKRLIEHLYEREQAASTATRH